MIYYAIPLRAKKTSKNWDNDVQNLVRTLQSISNNNKYKAVIACHDIPNIPNIDRFNVEFVKVKYGAPDHKDKYMADKNSKKKLARQKILESAAEGDLFMYLDADDVLHKDFYFQVSSLYESLSNVTDIILYSGYAYDLERNKIAYLDGFKKIFYRNCGSCLVLKITKQDLLIQDDSYFAALLDHTQYPYVSLRYGRALHCSFLPLVCYLVNHGSNDSNLRRSENHLSKMVDQYLCDDWQLLDFFARNFTIN